MKYKTLFALRLLLGLVVLAIGNGQTGGLGLVFQQIEAIGPRQWLNLMAGTIAPNALLSEQIARRFSSHSPATRSPATPASDQPAFTHRSKPWPIFS
jgi:hypothetical protein